MSDFYVQSSPVIVLIALFYLTLTTITLQGTLAVSIQKKKKATIGNSLAIQWLGLCTFINEGASSIPGWGTKIPQTAQCGQHFFLIN